MNNKFSFRINLLLIALSFCIFTASAQDTFSKVTSDFESWSSIALKAKFNKQFSASLEQGLRLSRNSATLEQALTELGVSYKFSNGLAFGLGTRYIYDKTNSGDFENKFRYNLDASYKFEVKRFELKTRLRYQNKSELDWTTDDSDDSKKYLRFKLATAYNIKNWKLDPQFSTEIFRNLETEGDFDKIRFTLATDYSLKKIGEIGIFYRVENEINTSLPKTTYIAGVKYTYTIKPHKK